MTPEELILLKISNPDGYADIADPFDYGSGQTVPMGFFEDHLVPPEGYSGMKGYEFHNGIRYFGIHKVWWGNDAYDYRGTDSDEFLKKPWLVLFWSEEDYCQMFARFATERDVDTYVAGLNGRLTEYPENIRWIY